MKKVFILCLIFFNTSVLADNPTTTGLTYVKSNYNVATTANRLESVLTQNGLGIFARIDHAAGAQSVGMHLPPTELIIFGNPNIGTQLMKCRRTVGIDLPLKALIYKDSSGYVLLAYNDPKYLRNRHNLRKCREILNNVSKALANFAKAATQ